VLRVEGLLVRLGGFTLDVPLLEVRRGEYMVVMGPSGVGKTLLLYTVTGFVKPSQGRIIVDGVDVTRLPPERRGVALVPQEYALWPHMTVYENIAYGLRVRGLRGRDVEERVLEVAERLGIRHLLGRKPSTLSGGEKQRVALARALVVEPKLLLLDEPTASLDPGHRFRVWGLLRRLHRDLGFTALHVTNNIAEALYLGDRVAFMEAGRLVDVADASEAPRRWWASRYLEEYRFVARRVMGVGSS